MGAVTIEYPKEVKLEVKHQVFVSSTYRDLIEERKSVIHALLELDCIPAGMELFPATDEDAWTLIKEVIDGCDYYVLILAGKYGSTNAEGVSYTEMEFDYAVSINKPIIAFLHENLDSLSTAATEKVEAMQEKLNAFREKAKLRHCKFWNTPEDLGGKVSRSLIQLKKRHPSPGWVPGKYAATETMLREMQELRAKVAQYEIESLLGAHAAPAGTELLAQGTDPVEITISLRAEARGEQKPTKIKTNWDRLFSYCGPLMMNECTDEELFNRIKLSLLHSAPHELIKFNPLKDIVLPYIFEDKVRVQLQALGMMAPGIKKRAVADTTSYWRLTPYGGKYLLGLNAEKKPALNT